MIIYSDPKDDGFVKGPVYPNGPFRPADGIQRGSIQYLWEYPGDPLTPGRPSVPGTPRLQPDQAQNLSHTPTTPISYREAEPLLRALGGPAAPDDFQGGLGFQYHVGPGPTSVHMKLDIDYGQAPLNDAFAVIPGREHPDEFVMLGGHQDAWTYGANDDLSGWSSVLEVGKRLGALMRQGWRPDRTIVLAGWDGEEYGLLGSTEWTEQYERALHAKAVAYLNVDITAGQEFGAGAAPAARQAALRRHQDGARAGDERLGLRQVARLPRGADGRPPGQRLGLHRALRPRRRAVAGGGLHEPPAALGTTRPTTTPTSLEHFLDPGYRVHEAAAAKVLGVTALRLANADVYPLRYSDYATALVGYVDDLAKVRQQARRRAGRPVGAAGGAARTGARRRAAWRPVRRSCWPTATAAVAMATATGR